MRKRLVRKTFDMIQEIAEKDGKEVRAKDEHFFHSKLLIYLICVDTCCHACCRTTTNSGRALASS